MKEGDLELLNEIAKFEDSHDMETGITPIHQIRDISTTNYQATGLRAGSKYYFAVTTVDKTGNENKRVACVNVTTMPMPRGTASPDISVDSYNSILPSR